MEKNKPNQFQTFIDKKLERLGDKPLPELIAGSAKWTVFKDNLEVRAIKERPTYVQWYNFLNGLGWIDDGSRLLTFKTDPDWKVAYGLAKTFTGKTIRYDFAVERAMFDEASFLCFPEAMEQILKAGYLDCDLKWHETDRLSLWATLDYPEHYNKDVSGMNLFYWEGVLDRNGILLGKLELKQSDELTY